MTDMKERMPDTAVLAELQSKSKLNMARQQFSFASARIEQAAAQHGGLPPIEMRRMEFEAVEKIAEALGVKL